MKKIFLVLFSLIMMCSVSLGIEANVEYSLSASGSAGTNYNSTVFFDTYTGAIINNIIKNYCSDSTNETYISNFDNMINSLRNSEIKYILGKNGEYLNLILLNNSYVSEVCHYNGKIFIFLENDFTDYKSIATVHSSLYSSGCYDIKIKSSSVMSAASSNSLKISELIESNISIYNLTYTGTKYYWDGFSYFYQVPEQGGSAEINLTDEQIAEIVERFVNSEAFNNHRVSANSDDFFITYDTLTKYYRAYNYRSEFDLSIEFGNYDEEGNFITTGTEEGDVWLIRPYVFEGNIFYKFSDWLSYKLNAPAYTYFSISPDSSIEPRFVGSLEHNYCSNYRENEVVIYTTKQIRFIGEKTNDNGETETEVIDNYIPPTVLKDSETGEQIIIRDNLQNSSDNLENIITPNADFSGLKQAFEKYISFIDISSITWLTSAISSMIVVFIPFVALGIIIFLINRILNGGS